MLNEEKYEVLPPPEVLAEYEEISAGATKRLLSLAEREQQHRHRLEEAYLIQQVKTQRIGQLFGFVVAMVIAIMSSILVVLERYEAAMIVAAPGFLAFAIVGWLTYRINKNKNPQL